jgi:putative ABC transport system ATP-binding protein
MIKLENITKIYNEKKKNELIVLNKIDLEIKKGSMIAIVGPSGSGKSTLLNIIGCMDKPSGGTYLLNNESVVSLNQSKMGKIRNQYFGFVVQDFALIENYTVFKNVEIPIQYSRNRSNKKKRILDVLEKLEIADKINEYAYQLSGGQRQRVAIARALINNPEIILADEPTGALDQRTGNQVLSIFKSIHKSEGKTIVMVTHNMEIAKECDQIIQLVDGKIFGSFLS